MVLCPAPGVAGPLGAGSSTCKVYHRQVPRLQSSSAATRKLWASARLRLSAASGEQANVPIGMQVPRTAGGWLLWLAHARFEDERLVVCLIKRVANVRCLRHAIKGPNSALDGCARHILYRSLTEAPGPTPAASAFANHTIIHRWIDLSVHAALLHERSTRRARALRRVSNKDHPCFLVHNRETQKNTQPFGLL